MGNLNQGNFRSYGGLDEEAGRGYRFFPGSGFGGSEGQFSGKQGVADEDYLWCDFLDKPWFEWDGGFIHGAYQEIRGRDRSGIDQSKLCFSAEWRADEDRTGPIIPVNQAWQI